MSGMNDPTQMAGQPSPEEMRAYLEQLRDADAAGLLAEAFNLLATGAQVKLGRPDARMLIDALAGMVKAADTAMPPEIIHQMNQGVAQLQMAQVQAERELAAEQSAAGDQSPPDAAAPSGEGSPAGDPGPPPPSGQGPGGVDKKMTDRLWIPGRDPRPPAR